MQYSCEQLCDAVRGIAKLERQFQALFLARDVAKMRTLRQEIETISLPIYESFYWRKAVCIEQMEINLENTCGTLNIALNKENQLFIQKYDWQQLKFKNADEREPEIPIGNLDIDLWQNLNLPYDSKYKASLIAPPITSSDDSGAQYVACIVEQGVNRYLKVWWRRPDLHKPNSFENASALAIIDKRYEVFVGVDDTSGGIIAGTEDGKIGFLYVNGGYEDMKAFDQGDEVISGVERLEVLPGGKFLISKHDDFQLYLWDIYRRKLVSRLPIIATEFTINPAKPGEIVYASGKDLRTFDIETLTDKILNDDVAITSSLSCSKDGRYLASGSTGVGGAHIIDLKTGEYIREVKGGVLGYVGKVFFTDKGDVVAASSEGFSIYGRKKRKAQNVK
jgi:WD40 repeat protein